MQVAAAGALQALADVPSAGEAIAALGAAFVGGTRRGWVFRYLRFRDYPLGGTSMRVRWRRAAAACGGFSRCGNYGIAYGGLRDSAR